MSTLDTLRSVRDEIADAEAESADRALLLALWRKRRDAIHAALADERRMADIAKALQTSRQNVERIIA